MEKICERVEAWKAKCLQRDGDRKRIDELREESQRSARQRHGTSSLAAGIASAKRAIVAAGETRAKAESLGKDAKRLEADLGKAQKQLVDAKDRLAEWEKQWADAVAVIKLADVSPAIETAQSYLLRIDQMQKHLSDMRIKEARVREIQTERSLLLERIGAVRQRLDPTCRPTTADSLDADFQTLESDLEAARTLRTVREGIERQLAEIETKLAGNRKKLADATASLQALALEAQVEVESLADAVQRARERTVAAKLVLDYESAVAENAQGQPMEQFIDAALATGADLEQQIADLETRAGHLDREISEADARFRDAERVLAGYQKASDAAAEAQQQAAMVESRIEEKAIEYAALHLARATLDKAKERYRARHQDTLLDRAGTFFRDLTSGAFSSIDIDYEEGTDILKAVRADHHRPDARVPVGGLSDGTRDQLFLALRLAAIEQHLKDREPVPLIVDDVLVSFDDGRARATLGCLAELAKQTQVILFTHHKHIVDLARSVDPSTAVHDLAAKR